MVWQEMDQTVLSWLTEGLAVTYVNALVTIDHLVPNQIRIMET